jgi:hypothetical protein
MAAAPSAPDTTLADTERLVTAINKATADIRHVVEASKHVLRDSRAILQAANALIASSRVPAAHPPNPDRLTRADSTAAAAPAES